MCEPFDFPTPDFLFFPSKWHLAEADPGEGPRPPLFLYQTDSPPPLPRPALSEALDPPLLGTNSRWAFVVCCLLFTVCLKRDSSFTVLVKICKVYGKIEQPYSHRTRSRIRLESFEFPASLWLANIFWQSEAGNSNASGILLLRANDQDPSCPFLL